MIEEPKLAQAVPPEPEDVLVEGEQEHTCSQVCPRVGRSRASRSHQVRVKRARDKDMRANGW